MSILLHRSRQRTLAVAVLALLIALLACKKAESDDDSTRDESSESDDQADEDEPKAKVTPPAPVAADEGAGNDPAEPSDVAGGQFKVGDAVDVEWKGDWWKAEVKRVRAGPVYYIHYVGWGNEWDEWVAPRRIRARTAGSRTN